MAMGRERRKQGLRQNARGVGKNHARHRVAVGRDGLCSDRLSDRRSHELRSLGRSTDRLVVAVRFPKKLQRGSAFAESGDAGSPTRHIRSVEERGARRAEGFRGDSSTSAVTLDWPEPTGDVERSYPLGRQRRGDLSRSGFEAVRYKDGHYPSGHSRPGPAELAERGRNGHAGVSKALVAAGRARFDSGYANCRCDGARKFGVDVREDFVHYALADLLTLDFADLEPECGGKVLLLDR